MFGHEYYNWMETEDGYVIDWIEDETRLGWYYCELNNEGKFSPSHIPVKYPTPDNLHIPRKLKESNPYVRKINHSDPQATHFHNSNLNRSTETKLIKPLVFLVDFENLPSGMPDREYSKEQFRQLLFETDLESDGSTLPLNYDMSVRDYYSEISNGNLEVFGNDESIVDWTTVSQNYSYYVDGEQGTGGGPNGIGRSAASLVVEIAMGIESNFDFSKFDGDDDGSVDLVILIVEGWGDGDDDQFWPHMSLIHAGSNGIGSIDTNAPINEDGYFSLDAVAIKKYIVIPEQFHMNYFGVGKYDIHPIGTICHEMGHVLGLPDLYDTSVNSAAGIGEWGLMGSGNWQRPTSPAYMSAWSRYHLEFINPIIMDNLVNIEEILLPAESGEESLLAMVFPMDSNMPQEYLILENRQAIGSDQHLEKSGLLVWHIDETITGMYPAMNSVNVDPEFYGVNLLQADGEGDLYKGVQNSSSNNADNKDPFPGSMGVSRLTSSTNPNTNLYNYDRNVDGVIEFGGESNIGLFNITENIDSTIILSITNPNKNGEVIGYDEGGNGIYAWSDNNTNFQWVGIKYSPTDTALFSGVLTVINPTTESSFISDYSMKIWKGWKSNTPLNLLAYYNGVINWSSEYERNGGWIFISLLDEEIILYPEENYYIEFNYNGTEFINNFDYEAFSGYPVSNNSYYRPDENTQCNIFQFGDWNIRAVLSGEDDFENLSTDIPEIPQKHEIYSNYPNPFNPVTTLSIYLANPSAVSYVVFDLRGRQILQKEFTLLEGGRHEIAVNMEPFSSGVYLYQFSINNENYSSQKMVLLK